MAFGLSFGAGVASISWKARTCAARGVRQALGPCAERRLSFSGVTLGRRILKPERAEILCGPGGGRGNFRPLCQVLIDALVREQAASQMDTELHPPLVVFAASVLDLWFSAWIGLSIFSAKVTSG